MLYYYYYYYYLTQVNLYNCHKTVVCYKLSTTGVNTERLSQSNKRYKLDKLAQIWLTYSSFETENNKKSTHQVCLCIVLADHFAHITKCNSTSLATINTTRSSLLGIPDTYSKQAQNEYKHSLTFRVWHHVVIATKPVHRLQIRPIVHN